MKTTSLAFTVSRMRFATVVLPEPVPPEMPMIKLKKSYSLYYLIVGAHLRVRPALGGHIPPPLQKCYSVGAFAITRRNNCVNVSRTL